MAMARECLHILTEIGTEEVLEVLCEVDGEAIVLVDTPGFNDTNLSDIDVLTRIAERMKATYGEGTLLSGIIYLHKITDNRMEGSETLNLRMFKKLCGLENLKSVILGTTMWELTPENDAIRREHELKEILWKDMLDRSSVMERIYRQPEFARGLIRKLLQNQPMATRLQQQMGSGQQLKDTDAGAEMNRELALMEERLVKQFEAANLETQKALRDGR